VNTTKQITPKPNSFKTNVLDSSGVIILAEWFSLNERTDAKRQEISRDIGAVILGDTEVVK
jgi:hypothetical protein